MIITLLLNYFLYLNYERNVYIIFGDFGVPDNSKSNLAALV